MIDNPKPSVRTPRICVVVSADAEWRAVRRLFPDAELGTTPFGEYFPRTFTQDARSIGATVLHGGWGKVSAAASAQHALDRWRPELIVNLGTCGGFAGRIERGEIVMAERTVIYDIIEQMGSAQAAIEHYAEAIDLSWLPPVLPVPVRRALLLSADRDLLPGDVERLHAEHGAVVGDWESGAIAWVAARNNVRCLILRCVSDIVGTHGGEAYEDPALFAREAHDAMARLFELLPAVIP